VVDRTDRYIRPRGYYDNKGNLLDIGFDVINEWLTSKTNKTEFDEHTATNVTDSGGVHGVEITSGTFAPTIRGSTTAGTNTYSVQDGNYYCIGKLCHIDIRITLSAKDAAMAGNITINTLPFASKNNINRRTALTIGMLSDAVLSGTRPYIKALITPNTTAISLWQDGDNITGGWVQHTNITNATSIVVGGAYEIE